MGFIGTEPTTYATWEMIPLALGIVGLLYIVVMIVSYAFHRGKYRAWIRSVEDKLKSHKERKHG